jgi:hypothetical protein
MMLVNSTVSGNTSNNPGNTSPYPSGGGGIYNGGTMTLLNSTVSSNMTNGIGGGIANYSLGGGTINLTSVTMTLNQATGTTCTDCAGGINNLSTATLKNTIVAGNTSANASAPPDFGGATDPASAFNLIGIGTGTTGIANADANSNQVGSAMNPIDPKLDQTLKPNGGTTLNHALLSGSPAIDKGNSFTLTTDQREFKRPVDFPGSIYPNATNGDGSDIGAFEVQASPTAATVAVSGRVTTASGRGIQNVRLSLTDSNGQVRTALTTSFGYYRFDDIQAGDTYILSAAGKHYTFSQPLQVLNVNEETDEVNFIGDPEKRTKVF